ncbi:hypothetical protein DBR42_22605 [Pelomonas sp. HMWF004]|nr:hypothetical protein DBR42_22605 [Pelomonas sp. HMWF004]
MSRISTTSTTSRLHAVTAAVLVALTALTGAAWMTITAPDNGPAVIQFERVVIEGRRSADTTTAEVQQLPRVVIVGRRDTSADGTQVASACAAQTLC